MMELSSHPLSFSPQSLSFLLLFFTNLCLPSENVQVQWSSRVVTTKQGLTRGLLYMPRGYDGVEIFYGVPYASPPLGSLRLMPPVSGSPWTGTKMNEVPAPVCPQVFPFMENGDGEIVNETEILKTIPRGRIIQLRRLHPFLKNQSEDCLYLNVYVPLSVAEGKSDPVPVLVFIYGEEFSYGSAHAYNPSLLASLGNIIVVTFNYRLGILGFLNANSDGYFKSPANFALLDQIAALHWVQENIAAFGGLRSNVTLMGEGKGAMFANFLMISNALPAEPLFHHVILMSGSALSPITVGLSHGRDLAKDFAGRFKCPLEPPSNMLQCLRQLPLQYFLDSDLWKFFGPSDDGIVIQSGIRENILRERISRFPLLFGMTKAEFLPHINDHDATYGIETERRREILRQFIEGFYRTEIRTEILAAAVHEYTDWERPVQHPISVRDETLEALGDAHIVAPMVKVGELHSQSSSRTYFYVFEYQSKISDYVQRLGCVPGEDLLYVFGFPLYISNADWEDEGREKLLGAFTGNFTKTEVQLSQTVVQLWANFIKFGNPTPDFHEEEHGGNQPRKNQNSEKGVGSKNIEWPAYDSLSKKYLSIEAKPRLRNHYRAHKLAFWLHLVPELVRGGDNAQHILQRNDAAGNSSTHHYEEHIAHFTRTEQHPFFSGNLSSYQEPYQPFGPLGSRPHHIQGTYGEGIQIYSTALSVTIAVGCSLLILNILVFAAFYYIRDKSRAQRLAIANNPQGEIIMELDTNAEMQTSNSQARSFPSVHLNSNGQLGNSLHQHQHQMQMYGSPSPSNSNSTLASNSTLNRQSVPRNLGHGNTSSGSGPTIELSMPDAILAAAMVLNYRQNQALQKQRQQRPLLNMKDELLKPQGQGSPSVDESPRSSSKQGPNPPKRGTPVVKFSPDICAGTGTMGESANVAANNALLQQQGILKSSLKKMPELYNSNDDQSQS